MTVAELMEILKTANPNDLVVLSRDAEGNGYELLRGWDLESRFNKEEGEIGLRELTPDAELAGYSEEDVMEDGQDCIVFWP